MECLWSGSSSFLVRISDFTALMNFSCTWKIGISFSFFLETWVTIIKLTFNIILDKVSLVQMSETLSLSLVSCLQSALKLALGNWFEGCQVDKCWDNKASTTTKIFCSTSSEWFFKCKKAWNNKNQSLKIQNLKQTTKNFAKKKVRKKNAKKIQGKK